MKDSKSDKIISFMKDSKLDKIALKAKIHTQFERRDWSPDLMKKLTVPSISLWLRV
jgi:hypothetical protein